MRLYFFVISAAALAAGCAMLAPDLPSGASLFAENCSACHGPGGKGDGPAADGFSPRPADLTMIAARNGGAFPREMVMSRIDGYAALGSTAMPEFGDYLEGNIVLDGNTPTPDWLIALADYLASIQQKS